MKTFCVPLINASWLYWPTVHQLWSSFYFYPFSHEFFINFPVIRSSMGSERGTINMWRILFIMIGMKTVPAHNFPEWYNVGNWRIMAPCRFLKGISDCPLTLLIDLPHLECGCCTLRKNGLFAVGIMWKKEQGSSVLIYSCTKLKWLLWSHSFILSTQWHLTHSTLFFPFWHKLFFAAVSCDTLLLMFPSIEEKGDWFSRDQTAVRKFNCLLLRSFFQDELALRRSVCLGIAGNLAWSASCPASPAAGAQLKLPACIQEHADALLRWKQEDGNGTTSIIQVFLYLKYPRSAWPRPQRADCTARVLRKLRNSSVQKGSWPESDQRQPENNYFQWLSGAS